MFRGRWRMTSWRDEILKEFVRETARLTLAADPDGLLLEEETLKGIAERGFDLIPYEDPVAFRFAFETRYRSRWDGNEPIGLVVVSRDAGSDLGSLPYDLFQAGRRLSFSLGDFFPMMSYPVIQALNTSDLDALYTAEEREKLGGPLGDSQTRDFVLRHVFGVAPETIKEESHLVHFLIRRHYSGLRIPPVLDDYLIKRLRQNRHFDQWPLDRIVPDAEAFFEFLQERWPAFLDRQASPDPVMEPTAEYMLEIPGPVDVPFDHGDVRAYVDDLFQEGFLRPVPHPGARKSAPEWALAGVKTSSEGDRARRLAGLLATVEKSIPAEGARYQEWLGFAQRWAHANALIFDPSDFEGANEAKSRHRRIRDRIDEAFSAWIAASYSTLHNQPPSPPVMIHHVPRSLARRLGESAEAKVALVVVDGLALDQWVVIREVLGNQRPTLRFREGSLFAWIPTLTAVSRQACFSGRAPLYFPNSIHSTGREPSAWKRFWADHGLASTEVEYLKKLRRTSDLGDVRELVSRPKVRAVGLVVDTVDQIMHGTVQGSAGMHNQVRQWANDGMLAGLLDMLLDSGFAVFLTSDHGNVETRGCGRPAEGVMVDAYGKRARIYGDSSQRGRVKKDFPDAIEWPRVGLPDGYCPLLAPGRMSFVRGDERPVAHGGATLEEVVVPLVEVERR